ncbi:MerR family transcriptional regulator [Streptomyces sp. NPDC091383]|uniref:MerR family transcriptional regulator n=1 Tax=Streptomyces sp. NPDC091383 TaxID=3365996 RepID=UPI00381C0807
MRTHRGSLTTSATWRVGRLARAGGLTVRTPHHGDTIGLLSPSRRTPGGHREYTEDDLVRPYRVPALRGLGPGLDTIAVCLDAPAQQVPLDELAQVPDRYAAAGPAHGGDLRRPGRRDHHSPPVSAPGVSRRAAVLPCCRAARSCRTHGAGRGPRGVAGRGCRWVREGAPRRLTGRHGAGGGLSDVPEEERVTAHRRALPRVFVRC